MYIANVVCAAYVAYAAYAAYVLHAVSTVYPALYDVVAYVAE